MDGSTLTIDKEITTRGPHDIHSGTFIVEERVIFESDLRIIDVDMTFACGAFFGLQNDFKIAGTCNLFDHANLTVSGRALIQYGASLVNHGSTSVHFLHTNTSTRPSFTNDGTLINNGNMTFVVTKTRINIDRDGKIKNRGSLEVVCVDWCELEIENEITGSGDVVVGIGANVIFSSLQANDLYVFGDAMIETLSMKREGSGVIIVNDTNAFLTFSADNEVREIKLFQGIKRKD